MSHGVRWRLRCGANVRQITGKLSWMNCASTPYTGPWSMSSQRICSPGSHLGQQLARLRSVRPAIFDESHSHRETSAVVERLRLFGERKNVCEIQYDTNARLSVLTPCSVAGQMIGVGRDCRQRLNLAVT